MAWAAFARCGAHREPVTRTSHGDPLCANCFITDPANLQTSLHCGQRYLEATPAPCVDGHVFGRYLTRWG